MNRMKDYAIDLERSISAQRYIRGCYCPDDCGCQQPWRTNYCGCKAPKHDEIMAEREYWGTK